MTPSGPLAGLRVIDLTDDLGRFGTKLLAELGADVCRPAGWGSRGHPLPGPAGRRGGHLDWWYDAAKGLVDLDLDDEEGRSTYRRLTASAHLVIESLPPGHLAERGIDHADLVETNPLLTQVALTPWGRTGPRASWRSSDLVAGAMGGVLSLTGTPDRPLNSWGGQNHNFGGFAAAVCGLAGVRAARRDGRGQLVDLSLHEVVAGSIENLFMQYRFDDVLDLPKVAARQGSLHWLGLYEVVPARTGNVMITPTPQVETMIDWMIERGIDEARPLAGMPLEDALGRVTELMGAMKAFCRTDDAGPLFHEAQRRHIAFGEVQSVSQVARNPQFEFRELYGDIPVAGEDGDRSGSAVRGPWRLVRFSETPIAIPGGLPAEASPATVTADRWATAPAPAATGRSPDPTAPPLDGIRVLDLSWVLAGPFATRLLGDLGADVVKVQTEERATLVNQPGYPYYQVWNRSKRSVTIDLKNPGVLQVVRRLVERCDVLVENYSAGVLARLGLGWDQVRSWNDRLVYVSMSGCGHEGPWKDIISYAPTVHAVCGLTRLTNPPGRGDVGCGFSLNDHAAGFGAALSILAALEVRERTGRGQYIDMAQLEVGAVLIGPALVDHFATGRVTEAAGNLDGLADRVPNEVSRCRDDRYLAVTAEDDAMWARLAGVIGLDDDEAVRLATVEARRADRATVDAHLARWCEGWEAEEAMAVLQEAGVAAGVVQDAADLAERDPQLAARSFWVTADLAEFGPRVFDRFPARWSTSQLHPYRPAPSYLGEHNFEVLTELGGLDVEDVAEGVADGRFA
jgi:crotonobetainyl-CoA:carnitine CoA-transferase CaiB-like acyl-CoA transferase